MQTTWNAMALTVRSRIILAVFGPKVKRSIPSNTAWSDLDDWQRHKIAMHLQRQDAGSIVMQGAFVPTPTSSFIQGVQYSKRLRLLTVFFKKSTYRYRGVHPITARRMVETNSVGRYYHRNIVGHDSVKA